MWIPLLNESDIKQVIKYQRNYQYLILRNIQHTCTQVY